MSPEEVAGVELRPAIRVRETWLAAVIAAAVSSATSAASSVCLLAAFCTAPATYTGTTAMPWGVGVEVVPELMALVVKSALLAVRVGDNPPVSVALTTVSTY
jgi:hypothetical protein